MRIILFLLLVSNALFAQQDEQIAKTDSTANEILIENRLIEFPDTIRWLNTQQPLSIRNFEGRFLLLSFWTSSSSLSVGQLKELNRLSSVHDNLDIVIVHSGKYESERLTTTLRNFIVEQDIKFPLVNDSAFVLFSDYGIEAWPTNILADPTGKIILRSEGMKITGDISTMIELYDGPSKRKGSFLNSEITRINQGILTFPSFITTDDQFSFFISDTRNNRIVQTDVGGFSEYTIGSGQPGFVDGDHRTAKFYLPRGTVFDRKDSVLYIADTGNDAIRKFDLETRIVTTLLGNGERAHTPPEMIVERSHGLNQPTDLVIVDRTLYFTMTGWNQIWMIDLENGMATPVAGNGEFGFTDGRAMDSKLAEPYGITCDETGVIYFTERQSGAIRSLNRGRINIIAGAGIFDYGDEDGRLKKIRMQGPTGVCYHDGNLYVSDQYNHKIKIIDPNKSRSESFLGSGKMGFRRGVPNRMEFNHPNGLTVFRNELFIADTYNQVIRRFNFSTEIIRSFDFMNKDEMEFNPINSYDMLETDTIEIPRGESQLVLHFKLDSMWVLAQNSPQSITITSRDSGVVTDEHGVDDDQGLAVLHVENYGSYNHFVAEITLYFTDAEREQNTYIRSFNLLGLMRVVDDAPIIQDVQIKVPTVND